MNFLFGKHPRGLPVLFFSEMWERFSFYGMRALLVLYMVDKLSYAEGDAKAVYGAYGALVYMFPVLGGYLANQFLGYRKSILLGGVMMAIGHFIMAYETREGMFTALSFIAIGNGFFKPNISSTVGRLYEKGSPLRDSGFTIFYQGINIGAFSAPLICGAIGETREDKSLVFGIFEPSWSYGFGLAGVGMLVGLFFFLRGQEKLDGKAEPDYPERLANPIFAGLNVEKLIWIGCLIGVPAVAFLFSAPPLVQNLMLVISVAVVAFLLKIMFVDCEKGPARDKMVVLLVLMFFHMLFWAGFEQAGTSFTLLAKNHLNRDLFGISLSASQYQAFNPLFIIALAPVFAIMWEKLTLARKNPSIPMKFSLALFQLGAGFFILVWGAGTADSAAKLTGWFMVLCYLLHTTGELCLSPIGLSAVTKLVPEKITGFAMGAWFLTIANAHLLAAGIAGLTGETKDLAADATDAMKLATYTGTFEQVGWIAVGAGVLLALLSPFLKKMLHDVE